MQNIQIIRSRRKTMAIEVHPDGNVLVRAPLRAAKARIDSLLAEKQDWIAQKLAIVEARKQLTPAHRYEAGELFPYLGSFYPLELADRSRPSLAWEERFSLARVALPKARQVFTAWYKAEASRVFARRMEHWSQVSGLKPASLSLSSASTRWGSCGPNGSINLTWRLVMAPLEAIDYVIVHELAHLAVKNHSQNFWREVEKHLPGYRQPRSWLKENGHRLNL